MLSWFVLEFSFVKCQRLLNSTRKLAKQSTFKAQGIGESLGGTETPPGTRHNDNFLVAYRTYVCSLVVYTLSNSLMLNPPRPAEISRPASRGLHAPLRVDYTHRQLAMRVIHASPTSDACNPRIAN